MIDLSEIQQLVRSHSTDGITQTTLPNLTLFKSSFRTDPVQTNYEPSVCVAVQGAKLATLGESSYIYRESEYLIVSANLPLAGSVIAASALEPYLGLKLRLDRQVMASLLVDMPERPDTTRTVAGLTLGRMTSELLEALVRLTRLLSAPADIPVLAAMLEREITYRLMTGEHADLLRQLAIADSQLSRINRAVDWMRQHYSDPLRIDDLAEIVGMSVSSFYQHFKSVTSMSPLRYQKHIRLNEARRLILSKKMNVTVAGFEVGYDSPSQFSREYKRTFGVPPARDVANFCRQAIIPRRGA